MDQILDVLRTSVDNDRRKLAAAQLRDLQESHPVDFLDYTLGVVRNATLDASTRFFACTTVVEYVEESWHNSLSVEVQVKYTRAYVSLALSEAFPTPLLARKVALLIATMTRRGPAKAQPGHLPALLELVAESYVRFLSENCLAGSPPAPTAAGLAALPQVLLCVHMLLKETQMRRVGTSFQLLCRGLVPSLSAVFTALSPYSPLEQYDAFLFLFKCTMRVFGCGVFEPAFYRFLLDATWRLARGLDAKEDMATWQKRTRLVDYGLKTQEMMVKYFPSRLQELGATFFLPCDGSATDVAGAPANGGENSLFELIDRVVVAGTAGSADRGTAATVLPEKSVCRVMRLLTFFLTAEDGDAFVAECVRAFGSTEVLARLMRNIIAGCLRDDVGAEASREWKRAPEKVVEATDVDMDDEVQVSCAEQLFLALTGSTAASEKTLSIAWETVNSLLQSDNVGDLTAALHAVGIGYYTMSQGSSRESYLSFLHDRLLPMLSAACDSVKPALHSNGSAPAPTAASPFVLRRVIWLTGMWCESVEEPAQRLQVHQAYDGLLHAFSSDAVVILTTLRATENFVTDSLFTLQELPPSLSANVLAAMQAVMPHLSAPSTVRQLACLARSMIEKGVVCHDGDAMLHVFGGALVRLVANCEADCAAAAADGAGNEPVNGDADVEPEDEGMALHRGVLAVLLDCVSSLLHVCASPGVAWQLFLSVIVPCTESGRQLTPWVEDSAWALMLTMARTTATGMSSSAEECAGILNSLTAAVEWCRINSQRDFESLPLVIRTDATLRLLLLAAGQTGTPVAATPAAMPDTRSEDAAFYLGLAERAPSEDLSLACTLWLLTAVATECAGGRTATAEKVVSHCAGLLTRTSDVQSESFAVGASLLLVLATRAASSRDSRYGLSGLVSAGQQADQLLENLVLVLDVCPNAVASKCIASYLSFVATSASSGEPTISLSADVVGMLTRAAESAFSANPLPQAASGAETDMDGAETRCDAELLLEMLGDEDCGLTDAHSQRLQQVLGPYLLFA